MARMLDISDDRRQAWLNLDNVLWVEQIRNPGFIPGRPGDAPEMLVQVYSDPNTPGIVLPEHITLSKVVELMQPGAWIGRQR